MKYRRINNLAVKNDHPRGGRFENDVADTIKVG